jgi:dCTP deaminase
VSGGVLSDRAIADAVSRGDIHIDPFDMSQLNPSSYDMTLGDKVAVYAEWVVDDRQTPALVLGLRGTTREPRDGRHLSMYDVYVHDVKEEPKTLSFVIGEEGWVLKPGILYLMHTREVVAPGKLVACADGKSSLGRLGIVVHQTAGFIDCGFVGQITLEVTVTNPIRVYAGMRFAQVRFHTVVGESSGYKGNYVGEHARGPVASRAWKQFKEIR